jgi:TRAP-type mannitol/chloroaromatic compound transport system permease small subunit
LSAPSGNEAAAHLLDRVSITTGRVVSWLTLIMVITTFIIVVMRYVFDAGLIWLQESVIWMHALVFMMGAAYTLQQDDHVRVDIFYRELSVTRRAWIDIAGSMLFLLPLCAFLAYQAYDFVAVSWSLHEASRESGGLPYPLIPMLKSMVLLMPIAVALQGVALMLRSVTIIRRT